MFLDTQKPLDIAENRYGIEPQKIIPINSGKVNLSFRVVTASGDFCLQRLNDYFQNSEALGHNWELAQKVITGHHLPFPEIVPAVDGNLLVADDGSWRLTKWLDGHLPPAGDRDTAYLAGHTLGLIHRVLNVPRPIPALFKLPQDFAFTNQKLASSKDFDNIYLLYRRHPNLVQINPLIKRAALAAFNLPRRPAFQRVFLARDLVIHGDPKRENFLVESHKMALLDWDTIGYGDPLIDLGELCRSFAVIKPNSEFQTSLAACAVRGYEESGFDFDSQISLLLPAVIRALCLNLTLRYLIDALAEVYFSWDPEKFDSLFAQNESRAATLLSTVEEMETSEMEFINLLTRA
ncbi:MAG: aminoglycoside phosphotransferase family protein [Deltaproteobacteria bacterium]|jgi:Ser/Thr protein kinase RdoA (MazF antagonist)|nr:aminoglycoside phosphotransferase family protein [Deltaproteobacteria bacterium]